MSQGVIPAPRFVGICALVQEVFRGIESHGVPVLVPRWRDAVQAHLSQHARPYIIEIFEVERQGYQIRGTLSRNVQAAKPANA